MKLRSAAPVAVAVASACAILTLTLANRLLPAAEGGAAELFRIERGASLSAVSAHLERRGLVRSALATEWLGRFDGRAGTLRSGEYEVSADMTPREMLAHFAEGPMKTWSVALPEGLRLEEIAARLEAAGLVSAEAFVVVARDPAFVASLGLPGESLEGYLFPETYRLPRDLPAREVARILTREFQKAWAPLKGAASERGLSLREVVILASIVEKETADPSERGRVASVFLNRLARKIPLATDPAVIYGIEDFDGNLKRKHLRDLQNPYNTYRHPGLPPGPISNPGAAALRAVVQPEETDYLFFVSRGDGRHVFSRTYAEHDAAVDRYQRQRRRP
jgi:UPF0755 protein